MKFLQYLLHNQLDESFKLFKDETIKQYPMQNIEKEVDATINSFKAAVSKGFLTGQEKDINYWRKNGGFSALHDKLLSTSNNMSKREGKILAKKADVIQLTDTPNYNVIIPLSPEAARMYGAGTKWCVSSKDPDHFNNYFANYNTLGRLVIIFLPKTKDLPKLAAAIISDKEVVLYDDTDTQVNTNKFNEMLGDDVSKIESLARSHMNQKDAAILKLAKTNRFMAIRLVEAKQIDPETVKDVLLSDIAGAVIYLQFGGKDYQAVKDKIPLKGSWDLGRILRHMPKKTWPEAEQTYFDFVKEM